MKIELLKTKDNNSTVKINNILIHSLYNPVREAENFVSNLSPSINPSLIFIIEPGFSYILPSLRLKYPKSRLCCIRFIDYFKNYDSGWDDVINYDLNFTQKISSKYTEEQICSSVFYSWKPSENIFKEDIIILWNNIKQLVEKSRTLLVTREYFEKKWLINFCNFYKYTDNFITYKNTIDKPVVITASGPSLLYIIDELKQYRNCFFLIALSSSISVLKANNITPDLYFSTDGGYWADYHLRPIESSSNTPLAISTEAYISKKLLHNTKILPLIYQDGLSFDISAFLNLSGIPAQRNGTVSGTALQFALNFTSNNIFFCGLDLAPSQSCQHSRPNMLDINTQITTTHLRNYETNQTFSRYKTGSLNIYRDWFCNLKNVNKIFRIIDSSQKSLGNIQDINKDRFISLICNNPDTNLTSFFSDTLFTDKKELLNKIKDYISSNIFTDKWQKQLFPLDFTAMNNCIDENQRLNFKAKITSKTNELYIKIGKIFND